MSSPGVVFLLLALLSGGLAHASHPFDNTARVSDEELDRMRGGFVVNWNGQVFLMPFSIDGIERLTRIDGQTFINGALVSPTVNPQALTPFTQSGQISVNAPTSPPTGGDSLAVLSLPGGAPPVPAVPAETNAGSGETVTQSAPNTTTANAQVSTQGSLIVIQNGVANSIALPPGTSLDSLATIIQNSVNDQVIRNITTMNITIDARMLAAQSRLDALLSQHGLR